MLLYTLVYNNTALKFFLLNEIHANCTQSSNPTGLAIMRNINLQFQLNIRILRSGNSPLLQN